MRKLLFLLLCMLVLACSEPSGDPGAISLHPENPHYFLFQGKPTLLISSAEHYGAVMNLEFDYVKYLSTLQEEGLNYTRLFCSGHVEAEDPTFGIEKNTMGPSRGNYLAPWMVQRERADSVVPVFDLDQWNPAYFVRLRSFVEEAGKRGIAVEITLSSSCYNTGIWSKNPLNPVNNVNIEGPISLRRVQTMFNGELLYYQEELVKKLVNELNCYGNIFYEVQNEPWSDHPCLVEIIPQELAPGIQEWQSMAEIANPVSRDWQTHITELIVETEKGLEKKHLIAWNIANFCARVTTPDPRVSIFNFHYAIPEAAVWNDGLKGVRGLDETGFMPHEDILYRSQAWLFLLAGGALYNNLDYSFTAGNEDGNWTINNNPGWGGVQYRKQLRIMKEFLESFEFLKMKTSQGLVLSKVPENLKVQVLAEEGKQYALYLSGQGDALVSLKIPTGSYTLEELNPASGEYQPALTVTAAAGELKLAVVLTEDAALRILRKQ